MSAGLTLRVLVADDEETVRLLMERVLQGKGHQVTLAPDGQAAIARLRAASVDVVFTDMRMPGAGGMAVLAVARERQPDAAVVVMTAFGTIETAVQAMQQGAREFLLKPVSLDHLGLLIDRLADERRLRDEHARLERLVEARDAAGDLRGESRALGRVMELVQSVAPSDSTVLVTGESGTGKELVARAVHAASARAKARFVPINCAALNPSLLESEMFGHEAGAFTGAVKRKLGLIEVARGGTLFLDEVGETEPGFQAKLLRVLQEREFYRGGATAPIAADVRVVAATNRDLAAEIGAGRFREDLFYRLNVFPIAVPPLRDRPDDIVPIAEHLLAGLARRLGRERIVLSPETEMLLRRHRWPGNVRELGNALERAALLCRGGTIGVDHLPAEVAARPSTTDSALHRLVDLPLREARERFERSYVREVLRATEGNVSESARRAGMGRSAFHEMLKRLELDPDEFREKS